MAQGEFTKPEAGEMENVLKEIMDAMPKKKLLDYVGHFNDLFLFIAAAKRAAPDEAKKD